MKHITDVKIIVLRYLVLFFAAAFVLDACNKTCDCTNESCPCFPFTISLYANANNSAEGSYATSEMDGFYLLRTTQDYQLIDSIKINFEDLYSSIDYNKIFRFSSETYNNVSDIRPFNFIVKNSVLNTSDTLSSITYTETLQHVLCNVCTNCDDEYIDCVAFDDINIELNCNIQHNTEVWLKRPPN